MGTAVPEWFRACLAWQMSAVLARESRQPWVRGKLIRWLGIVGVAEDDIEKENVVPGIVAGT